MRAALGRVVVVGRDVELLPLGEIADCRDEVALLVGQAEIGRVLAGLGVEQQDLVVESLEDHLGRAAHDRGGHELRHPWLRPAPARARGSG
jgi:hypothetical protein